ncbi:AraC family transcriptional regulator ligand-binding domain-containing protein [Pendulispora brunnea]|uniref:AraC family transcriptional regulator ligand-binding domain-containing protein n=1 Tax=Pendulispora brunnea TaxID=2905690 RepID=A0ABZ2KB60_9BACT
MRGTATNLASMARGVLQWARERGIAESDLLGRTPLDRSALDQSHSRIPRETHVHLWRSLEDQFGDPDFGLHHAETLLRPSSLGVVGLLSMTSATVAESIHRATTYSRILKPDIRSRMVTTDRHVVVELESQSGSPRSVADCSLLAYLLFLRRWTGENFAAREVHFQHARPAQIREYERWFRCPVHFGQRCNSIAFDREVAELPLTTSQPDVAIYLEEQASQLLAHVPPESRQRTVDDVRTAVRTGVDEGQSHLSIVARRLGLGPRHLQRLLAKENLDYRALLDDARRDASIPLVADTDIPFEEIAARVGFTEARAFRRAFRRWIGISPSELRAARGPRSQSSIPR